MASNGKGPGFKALLFTSNTEDPTITVLPQPPAQAGTVLVRPLLSPIVHYSDDIFMQGNPRQYSYPLPIVPGTSAVAQLLEAPPDAPTLLAEPTGSLCWIDPVIRARDDAGSTSFLQGLSGSHSPKSRVLMDDEWRHGAYAEVLKVPAENVYLLDQKKLLGRPEDGGLGYQLADLSYISTLLVPYGGLAQANIQPGEVVVIGPATGAFGSAAVHVALALGADVVAMGRNEDSLRDIQALDPVHIKTIQISGDVAVDKAAILEAAGREPDVFFDISPPSASKSSHIVAGIQSLRPEGRVSFMGGPRGNVDFPYREFVIKNLSLRGTFMYTVPQVKSLIRMVEAGRLKIGEKAGIKCMGIFELEQWKEAFQTARVEGAHPGKFVAFSPNGKGQSLGT